MDNISNIVLTVMFSAIAVWLFWGYSKTRDMIFKDELWTPSRILFLAAGILCMLSAFVFSSMLDWIRLTAMGLCVIAFILMRDGVGEDAFAVSGRRYPYDQVRAYDYGDYKKQFRVYFVPEGRSNDEAIAVNLRKQDKEEIIKFLKGRMGKKYTRMRKG